VRFHGKDCRTGDNILLALAVFRFSCEVSIRQTTKKGLNHALRNSSCLLEWETKLILRELRCAILCAVWLLASSRGVGLSIPKTIQFFCTQDYDRQACLKDSIALRHALASYPLDQLGTWSFVLVQSGEWKNLVHGLGGDPTSPAFSIIEQGTTVVEGSLFSATPSRNKEQLLMFGLIGDALLDLAVTHGTRHLP
jgi:hypothetical protein